jgi:hypothetical protein
MAILFVITWLRNRPTLVFAIDVAQPWQPPAERTPIDDGALLVHKKLLQVSVSDFGAPVLRFVECRHYPKEHPKLVQVGMTPAGAAILRFVPGDYCVLSSFSQVSGAVGLRIPDAEESTAPERSISAPRRAATPVLAKSATRPSTIPTASLARLTAYQQYACNKFGPACSVALAIQLAENSQGACEAYNYNTDGTLDWGYFQINSVHLRRRGVNLRDLLDCKANIDFAYQVYREVGFGAWTTYVSGSYRRFLRKWEQYSRLALMDSVDDIDLGSMKPPRCASGQPQTGWLDCPNPVSKFFASAASLTFQYPARNY